MGASKKLYEKLQQEGQTDIIPLDTVAGALQTIQVKLKAPKDHFNDFAKFAYRTAGNILEKVKPLLEETGCVLTVDDEIAYIGDRYYVHSIVTLHHLATGEEIVSNGYAREGLNEKGKMESQMTGSASTFAKKYALCNLFAIDDSTEDPDAQKPVADQDRIDAAIAALNTAQNAEDIKTIKNYYADVMQDAAVIKAGIAAKNRLGY